MKRYPQPPRSGLVLDVETRIDSSALRASGRGAAPRGMPPGLQVLVAAATLSFEVDEAGVCGSFKLWSADTAGIGERRLVRSLEGQLARLLDFGGVLVTFNGGHDLSIVRLAALRQREFRAGGAAGFRNVGSERHHDVMMELSDGQDRFPRLADLAAAFGLVMPGAVALGHSDISPAIAKCEVDVVLTMLLYMHLLAEGANSDDPLAIGTDALATTLHGLREVSPHFGAILDGRLVKALMV